MIFYLVPRVEDLFYEYLELRGESLNTRLRILHYEQLPPPHRAEPGTYIVASADRFRPRRLQRLVGWCNEMAARSDVRVWNHPSSALTRGALLDALWRAGRNDFRAVRAGADVATLRYPVFVREGHTHRGALSPLLSNPRDVHAWIGRAVLTGIRAADLLVVEYCDTSDAAGFFRKYSAFVVGGRILPRSLEYGRAWMLKRNDTEFSTEMAQEELEYVTTNPYAAQLAEISAMARIDYGRIDYAVTDGRVQTWEINLNPTIGRGRRPARHVVAGAIETIREASKGRFYAAFHDAWDAADTAPPAEARPVEWPKIPAWLWLVRGLRRERWPEHLQRVIDPLAPVLRPLVTPWLTRVGRRAWQRPANAAAGAP